MTPIHLSKIQADARTEDLFAAAERRRRARRWPRRHAAGERRHGDDLSPFVASFEVPGRLGEEELFVLGAGALEPARQRCALCRRA